MFWFFDHEACGILAPWPGIEPALPALEGVVLTEGQPERPLDCFTFSVFLYLLDIVPGQQAFSGNKCLTFSIILCLS